MRETKELQTRYVLAVFILAVSVRLLHLFFMQSDPAFDVLQLDSMAYDRTAQQIAFEGGYPPEVYFQAPLYPYFLAGLYHLFGIHYDIVRIIQILLDSCSTILILLLTSRLFGSGPGVIAGLLASCYPVFIFESCLILKTTMTIFFTSAALAIVSDPKSKKGIWAFLLGIALGAGAATQGSVLLQIPLYLLWCFLQSGKGAPVRGIWNSFLLLLGFGCAIAPFTYRNYVVSHDFVLLTAQGGANFYLGNSPYSDGTSKRPPNVRMTPEYEERDFHFEAERITGRKLSKQEASSFWLKEALEWIKSNPGDAAKLQLRKFALFWNRVEVPDNYDFDFYRRYSIVIRYPKYPMIIPVVLGITGMVISIRRFRQLWMIHALVWSYSFITIAFHVYSRYRLPVVVYLLPFSGHAMIEFFGSIQKRHFNRLILMMMLAAIIFGFQSITLTHYSHAQSLFNQGSAMSRIGRLEEAGNFYSEALRVSPDYAPAMVNLGKLAYTRGDLDEAQQLWEQSLRIDPNLFEVYSNLGTLSIQQGMVTEAEQLFLKSIQIQPYYFLGWMHLGQLYQMTNRNQDAKDAFIRALELQPKDSQALFGLAQVKDILNEPDTVDAWQRYLNYAQEYPKESGFLPFARERIEVLNKSMESKRSNGVKVFE